MFGFEIIEMTSEQLVEKVQEALEEIRPFLQSDGGDISLVGIESDTIVRVRLEGACSGCSINQMTLKSGVEATIKKHAPQIQTVLNES
jgi:Fe-S cluster biogenesis protein NfuA